jgi:hypothetical protein
VNASPDHSAKPEWKEELKETKNQNQYVLNRRYTRNGYTTSDDISEDYRRKKTINPAQPTVSGPSPPIWLKRLNSHQRIVSVAIAAIAANNAAFHLSISRRNHRIVIIRRLVVLCSISLCQCWFSAFDILASHARSFASSKSSTVAKNLALLAEKGFSP